MGICREKEVKAEKEEEVGDDQALLGHQREQHVRTYNFFCPYSVFVLSAW
jgi:hypothetical protein